MKTHDILHGFEIVRGRESRELNGTLWEMRHLKTGAQLAWLDNGETNKLFSIAFKTLPWDDTGVFHILEHSVLGGSEHYPVKEPFLDLLKSSMNTFLNAMTFADKTMYPVSSRNEQDFLNLTHVYLDAVFCPAIYHNPNIFRQEGWHYELRQGDAEPTFKGVVFNEMKGAFASVNRLADMELCRMLFPDNCYGFVSGGDPEHIPDLTLENFLAAHRKFYHPSNAKIYLDGAVPLDKVLQLMDEEYLSKYGLSSQTIDISPQAPLPAAQRVKYYEIGKDEDEKQKAHIALGRIVGTWQDRKKLLAFSLLSMYLADSNEAPLKRAILQSGLAQDMTLDVDDSVAQPYSILHIRNTEQASRDELRRIIRETAEGLLQNGLDREELEAALNQLAFRLKENREPAGLMRNITCLNSWLHGGDPMQYLECEEVLDELRQALDTDYYENLLREMLLDDAHTAEVVLLPSKTLGGEKAAAEQNRLRKAQSAWTEEERREIMAQNASLDQWQASEDTPEALATLPTLPLSAVSPTPEWVETKEAEHEGVKVLFHPVASNGIVHATLAFSLADQSLDSLQALSFLSGLMGQLPTEKYTAAQLQREIKKHIGHIHFGVVPVALPGQADECRPFFAASFSALEGSLDSAAALMTEILRHTRFDDGQQIRDILNQAADGMYRTLLSAGNSIAMNRALSSFCAEAAVQEKTEGFDYYRYLTAFRDDFDRKINAFQGFAKDAVQRLFTAQRLILSETATERHASLLSLAAALQGGKEKLPGAFTLSLEPNAQKETILIPAGVSFAASAGHLDRYGQQFTGALKVLDGLLTYGYLWNEVRVKGGAYGCGFRATEAGSLAFFSYRDPAPVHSLKVFAETADFIRAFCESDESLEKYIISGIAATEPLLSPAQQGALADRAYISGMRYEDKLRIRQEMLQLTKEQLLSLCPLFEAMAQGNAQCIVGNENALKELGDEWKQYSL